MRRLKLIAAVLAMTMLLIAVMGRGGAESVEWVDDLTGGFVTAKERNRLLLVVLADDKDGVAKTAVDLLSDPAWGELGTFFVALKLRGEKADEVAASFAVESLPAVTILLPNGTRVMTVYEPAQLADALLSSIIGASTPPELPQILSLMEDCARRLQKGIDVTLVLEQDLLLKGLDKLIEDARTQPEQPDPNQPPQPRFDPNGKAMAESGSGDAGEGNVPGGTPDDYTPGAGGASDTARWGRLPPKLREDASSTRTEEIPPSYRQLVEEYFRSLMGE